MTTTETNIIVDCPVRVVYDQWTQFEEFPTFMDGVEQVEQVSDTLLHWTARVAGQRREWDAEIREQIPDLSIAWVSVAGARNAGRVSFVDLGDDRTEVTLQIDFEPEGLIEELGDTLGVVERRVESDLEHFKEFIESRGRETGAWRGRVDLASSMPTTGGAGGRGTQADRLLGGT